MRIEPQILDTADDVGRAAAAIVADGIERANAEGRPFILGCPSGRSAQTTYVHLAREVAERDLDLSHLVIALMDEYVVRVGAGFSPVPRDQPHSCIGFGEREIVAPLNRAARPGRGIPDANLWYPHADAPDEYDERLAAAGGIDVFLLASGSSDGHIALNPVDAAVSTTTRIVALEDSTRRDNLSTFPTFRGLDDVPQFGVTVGIRTIRDLSKAVIMLALGEQKQEAVRRIGSADAYDPSWPATVLSECREPHFFIDRAAGALLETAS